MGLSDIIRATKEICLIGFATVIMTAPFAYAFRIATEPVISTAKVTINGTAFTRKEYEDRFEFIPAERGLITRHEYIDSDKNGIIDAERVSYCVPARVPPIGTTLSLDEDSAPSYSLR